MIRPWWLAAAQQQASARRVAAAAAAAVQLQLWAQLSCSSSTRQLLFSATKNPKHPPRSLASGVAQRARGSNPGRTVVCIRRCEARRLLCQSSASTVEGIVDPSPSRGQAARAVHAAASAARTNSPCTAADDAHALWAAARASLPPPPLACPQPRRASTTAAACARFPRAHGRLHLMAVRHFTFTSPFAAPRTVPCGYHWGT